MYINRCDEIRNTTVITVGLMVLIKILEVIAIFKRAFDFETPVICVWPKPPTEELRKVKNDIAASEQKWN